MTPPPFRKVNFLPRRIDVKRHDDGTVIMRNLNPLNPAAPNLIAPLRQWADETPDHTWLAERSRDNGEAGDWQRLSYADANDKVNRLASALLAMGTGQDKPIAILSGNSIPHALMTYAGILAGSPVMPISPSYSLMSSDFAKLHHVFSLIRPAFVFVEDEARFAPALEALGLDKASGNVTVISHEGSYGPTYASLLKATPDGKVDEAYDRQDGDHVAKYLLTSGSTGMPKAVITTQKMMCVNAAMASSTIEKFPDDPKAVMVSWLPWNHCFGGNAVLNSILNNGGSLYIDGGRPLPGLFDETIRNLKEIAPTGYSNVPAAWAMLADALEQDDDLANNFFSQVRTMNYGGAAMGQDIYDRVQAVAVRVTGERIVFLSGYGATETAPTITSVHWETERMGLLGLPLPGIDLKLTPIGEKLEVRVRGDCITPGYYGDEARTKSAFDEDGFYGLGDGARFVDPENPEEGLVFDGRVAEDFKLSTGTWVNSGKLRVLALEATGGLLRDALITGLDEDYIGLLGFPNFPACQTLLNGQGKDIEPDELVRHPNLLSRLEEGLKGHNKEWSGSSTLIRRALLMTEPPNLDAGEITDKGYINQNVSLTRRAALVKKLYADPPGNDVIVL